MPKKAPRKTAEVVVFQVRLTRDDIEFLKQTLATIQFQGSVAQLEQLIARVHELQAKLTAVETVTL